MDEQQAEATELGFDEAGQFRAGEVVWRVPVVVSKGAPGTRPSCTRAVARGT